MKRLLYIIVFAQLFVIASCNHKDLCFNHREHAHKYHVDVQADYRYDWEECYGGTDWITCWPDHYTPYDDLRPEKPTGIRVINYHAEQGSNQHNIGADGGVVNLYEGPNDILFYNNNTEYIVFQSHQSGNRATTRATTRTRTRATYVGSDLANEGEETMTPPDMLFANFYEAYVPEKVVDPAPLPVTLQPLVYIYKVRYEFSEGLEYVARAQGALSGMARSVIMDTGETSEEGATILFEDCEITDWGVRAFVSSFGIPAFPNVNYPTRTEAQKNALNLEVLLRNGRLISFDFDVTEQVLAQPHGGVIIVSDIKIDPKDGEQTSGAFDVEVNDWGDYEDIDLPLF